MVLGNDLHTAFTVFLLSPRSGTFSLATPAIFSPPNQLFAAPTFQSVAIFLFLVAQFVLSVFRLILCSGLFDIYIAMFNG